MSISSTPVPVWSKLRSAARYLMKNLELKAEYPDLVHGEKVALRNGAVRKWRKRQIDTYFRVSRGRLKLREMQFDPAPGQAAPAAGRPAVNRTGDAGAERGEAELISYFRPDHSDLRPSRFQRLRLTDPRPLQEMLAAHWGVLVTVNKIRTLYMLDNIRIHLDQVDDLGCFLEFEGMIHADAEIAQTEARLRALRQAFAIDENHLIATSYSDLLLARKRHSGPH